MIDKILLLTRRREKYLVVAAVRFVRTILTRHVSAFILILGETFWFCHEFEPVGPFLLLGLELGI